MIGPLFALLAAAQSAPAAPSCTWQLAQPADVRVIAAEPDRWFDRCVRLDGYVSYNRFFSDVGGLYRFDATDAADRPNDGWVGLYPPARYAFPRRLRRASVIGRVHSCERGHRRAMENAGPRTLVMAVGYCHYRGGLVLMRAEMRGRSRAVLERLVGDDLRLRFGDLETESEVGAAPAAVRELGGRFHRALQAGDAAALFGLVSLWSEQMHFTRPRWVARYSAFLLGQNGSPLTPLREAQTPQVVYFRERLRRDEIEDGDSGDWHICFCKTADCTGLWPISALDATADEQRPYACVRAFDEQHGPNPPNRLGIVRGRSFLVEPARAAFRRLPDSSRR